VKSNDGNNENNNGNEKVIMKKRRNSNINESNSEWSNNEMTIVINMTAINDEKLMTGDNDSNDSDDNNEDNSNGDEIKPMKEMMKW